MPEAQLPSLARTLGYAGLLPPLIGLVTIVVADRYGGIAVWLVWAYAALILSFLGGVWWGLALASDPPRWLYPMAVLPSLVALASFAPLAIFGMTDLTAPMIWIGGALLLSPLIDVIVSRSVQLPTGWLRLRWHLSTGLGVMTVLVGLWA
jgi:hypothetical protein